MDRRTLLPGIVVWLPLAASMWLSGCDRGSTPPVEQGTPAAVFDGVDSALDLHATSVDIFERAFQRHDTNLAVLARGTISRILSDDTEGDRHQKFVLALSNGQTLLVAHNIDISPAWRG